MLKKITKKKKKILGGSTLYNHHMTMGSFLLNSRPMANYRKGGSTPRPRLALSEELSSQLAFIVSYCWGVRNGKGLMQKHVFTKSKCCIDFCAQ